MLLGHAAVVSHCSLDNSYSQEFGVYVVLLQNHFQIEDRDKECVVLVFAILNQQQSKLDGFRNVNVLLHAN